MTQSPQSAKVSQGLLCACQGLCWLLWGHEDGKLGHCAPGT